MGEKETSHSSDAAPGQPNRSETPEGRLPGGAVLSAAVSSVGNLAPAPSTPSGAAEATSNPLYSDPVNPGQMPAL